MEKLIAFILISMLVSPALDAIVLLNNTTNTIVSFAFNMHYQAIKSGAIQKYVVKKTSPLLEPGSRKQIKLLDVKDKLQQYKSFTVEATWDGSSVRCNIKEFPNDIDGAKVLFSYNKEIKKYACSITRINKKVNL